MSSKLSVLERKSEKKALATPTGDGRYTVTFEDGETREVASSTFKRLFTVLDSDVQQPEPIVAEEENEEEVVEESVEEESVEEEVSPVAEAEEVVEEIEATNELDALLSDAEEVSPEKEKAATPAPAPVNDRLQELGLNIKVRDWWMEGTKGGKTEKVKSTIEITNYLMEITEYDGYITNVVLFEELDPADVPENDPDATTKMVYRSPKMSLKDTLQWMGLSEDDAKIARKEITAIRKLVKLNAKEENTTELTV